MKYILNSFSPQMLRNQNGLVRFHQLDWSKFNRIKEDYLSIMANKPLARILNVECNKEHILLNPGDTALVAQLKGGQLPSDASALPSDVDLNFNCLKILE